MKQIKNVAYGMMGGLLFMTAVLTESCGKKESTTPPDTKPKITSFSPTTAKKGATITITGTNLNGPTAVSFGGTAATSFVATSATTITAVLGEGATGAVSVTTASGTATLAGFTYDATLDDVFGYKKSDEVEAANLIGYWPFDGNTTEKLHEAAPVLSSAAATRSFVPGVLGQAISFNKGWLTYGPEATGAGSNTTGFNSNDTLQYGFTISLWAQVPDTGTLTHLIGFNVPGFPQWPLMGIAYRRHDNGASFDFNGSFSNVDGGGPHLTYAAAYKGGLFNDSLSWAFLTMTYAPGDASAVPAIPGSLRYYANGKLRATINLDQATLGDQNPFPDPAAALLLIVPHYITMGASGSLTTVPGATAAGEGFMSADITGKIDDIRFFKRQLQDQQVEALFILGTQGR
ncbi:MAG: IPT/TIG domain-containing protein [Ferruginibacter sp.]